MLQTPSQKCVCFVFFIDPLRTNKAKKIFVDKTFQSSEPHSVQIQAATEQKQNKNS